ncbi:hypothetical protein ACOMHN_003757 [Nucella lapillus]
MYSRSDERTRQHRQQQYWRFPENERHSKTYHRSVRQPQSEQVKEGDRHRAYRGYEGNRTPNPTEWASSCPDDWVPPCTDDPYSEDAENHTADREERLRHMTGSAIETAEITTSFKLCLVTDCTAK